MQFGAVIKKVAAGGWLAGRFTGCKRTGAQQRKLIESLKIGAEAKINSPIELKEQKS